MICPTCQAKGEKSRVYHWGEKHTGLASHTYWDEDGKYHHHDPNAYTVAYSCTRLHQWTEKRVNTCWCGWEPTAIQKAFREWTEIYADWLAVDVQCKFK